MDQVFGRISFFVNAGVRFIEEHAKLRAMSILWEELGRERYGVSDPRLLRFRYGVQVNSLGLTEAQPENNVQRIVLEALAVTLGRGRPRPRDPAPGLERGARPAAALGPAVVAAHPAGPRLRDRHPRVPRHLRGLQGHGGARGRAARGGPRRDVGRSRARRRRRGRPLHEGRLVDSHRERIRRIESGEQIVVGQNRFTETEHSPLTADAEGGDPASSTPRSKPSRSSPCARWRAARDEAGRRRARSPRSPRPRRGEAGAQPDAAVDRRGPRGRHHRRVGAARCARCSASYRAPTGVGEAAAAPADDDAGRAARRGGPAAGDARTPARRSSSASPASTATPTAPSRSPCAPATSAWTSSTRASA